MKRLYLVWMFVAACSGSDTLFVGEFANLGQLMEAIEMAEAAHEPDSDGDHIADSVEERLGTDPNNPDTDGDGLVDNFELFGGALGSGLPEGGSVLSQNGLFDNQPLPDLDHDGKIAPLDSDDNGDLVNDGETIDTDVDGVPNYLEFYGYTYDFLTGRFEAWDGDPAIPHFFSDPLQWSTDQDSFSDATEASGAMLDPTVRAPGDDPLVPAYPNLVFELASYSVALNADITISHTESLSNTRSWTRQMTLSHSYTSEFNWSAGVEAGASSGKPHVIVKGDVGGSYSSTNTASTSIAAGESVTSSENWSTARSTNPSDAAHIKLFLKVHNRGTAPVSNLIPTLTLKIGGLNVATFEPGNSQVNMLVPGATYPAEPGVYWTVDSIDTGNTVIPLSLTMAELRALERGAPVSVTATQILGDVMRLSEGGVWERQGDTNEFVARCDAVSANIRIDLGQPDDTHPERRGGQIIHQLVYSGDGPSAPRMTLGAALGKLGVEGDEITYEELDGTPHTRSLSGFTTAVDSQTLRANGWEKDDGAFVPPPGWPTVPDDTGDPVIDLRPLRLFPYSTVYIKAPHGPNVSPAPTVHFAYFDSFNGEVMVSAADYRGIASVIVAAEDGDTLPLTEDVPGAGFYSGFVPAEFEGELSVAVTNYDGVESIVILGKLFVEEPPAEPEIDTVFLDAPNRYLFADVVAGNGHPGSAIKEVHVFRPTFPPSSEALMPAADAYKFPDRWAITLDPGLSNIKGLKIVAISESGLYAERVLTDADIQEALSVGSGAGLSVETVDVLVRGIFVDTIDRTWYYPTLNLDSPASATARPSYADNYILIPPSWDSAHNPGPPTDIWFRIDIPKRSSDAFMLFNVQYRKVVGSIGFEGLQLQDIMDEIALGTVSHALKLNEAGGDGVLEGDVFAVVTSDGRYAKVKIESLPELSGTFFAGQAKVKVRVSWVTFK